MKYEVEISLTKKNKIVKIFGIIVILGIMLTNIIQSYGADYPADTPGEAVESNTIVIKLSSSSPTSMAVKITDTNSWTGQHPVGSSPEYTLNYRESNNRNAVDSSKPISIGSQTLTLDGLKPNTKYSVWITYSYLPSGRPRMYLKTSISNVTTIKEQSGSSGGESTATCEGDFWECAGNWFGSNGGTIPALPSETQAIIDQLMNYINIVGTAAFMIVTAYLGIKYMYGSIESKADIKESMVTLIVAAIFFFGWQSIMNILYPGNTFVVTEGASDFGSIVNRIYSVFVYIGNFFAIGAIIYIGVKYLLAGASGKADLKAKSTQFLLGVVMTFATINFLTYISKVINAVLQ